MMAAYRSNDSPPALAPVLEARLRLEVADGERVLWKGTPTPWSVARRALPQLIFMLLWTGFAVFWTVGAMRKNGAFGLSGVPFMAIGLLTLYRATRPLRVARSTVYAVTTRRALVIEPGVVVSYTREMMTHLARSSERRGRCDLVFGKQPRTGEVGFWGISNGREVERLIREGMVEPTTVRAAS
jgi:hypothetical protein